MRRGARWEDVAAAAAGRRWLHGTQWQRLGEAALKSGSLSPPSVTGAPTAKGAARPIAGRVYFTDVAAMACDYAFGGWLGHSDTTDRSEWADRLRSEGFADRYGYIFEVSSDSFSGRGPRGVLPDEDAVGYCYYRSYQRLEQAESRPGRVELDEDVMDYRWPGLLERVSSDAAFAERVNDAASVMDLHDQAGAEVGDFTSWFRGGKKMVRSMGPSLAADLVRSGASISVRGSVKISAAWRVDKYNVGRLRKDCTNFDRLFEKVL